MDFWGIDRGKQSLRFSALEQIARMDVKASRGDITRLIAALGSREDSRSPLTLEELEVLLAIAEGAAGSSLPDIQAELISGLGGYLERTLEMTFVPGYHQASRIAPNPWTETSRRLTIALVKQSAPISLLQGFLNKANQLWTSREQLTDEKFLIWAYAYHGFLRGLGDQELPVELGDLLWSAIIQFMSDDNFRPELLQRLTSIESRLFDSMETETHATQWSSAEWTLTEHLDCPLWYPSTLSFELALSRIAVQLASITSDLPALASFSASKLEEGEVSEQFRREEAPHLIPMSAATSHNYFAVLHQALLQKCFDHEFAFFLAARAIAMTAHDSHHKRYHHDSQGELESLDDGIVNVARVAMESSIGSEIRLAQITQTLPPFLGSLPASVAFKVAKLIGEGFELSVSETGRVTVLYTLAKELTADEAEIQTEAASGDSVEYLKFVASILSALVGFVVAFNNVQLSGLAVTILSQKYGTVNEGVNVQILETYALIAPHLSEDDFVAILEHLLRAERRAWAHKSTKLIETVTSARVSIARGIQPRSLLHRIFLKHILDQVVLQGESPFAAADPGEAYAQAAKSVKYLIAPLAALLSAPHEELLDVEDDWSILAKFRNAWFSLATLGFQVDSKDDTLSVEDYANLKTIAGSTPPLVSETSANHVESDLELNTVLRRGVPGSVFRQQRDIVTAVAPQKAGTDIVKMMFYASALFLEGLRVRAGFVSGLPRYFEDPDFRTGTGYISMRAIARYCMADYTRRLMVSSTSNSHGPILFSLEAAATQLKEILVLCCHRVDTVRQVAVELADYLIGHMPSTLCHPISMFALLDLLTLMQDSVVDAEEDEYEPRVIFSAPRSGVRIELSDKYDARQQAVRDFEAWARSKMSHVLDIMQADSRSLLGIYLEESQTYGGDDQANDLGDATITPLGRTVALDLGRHTRGDFLAQYFPHKGIDDIAFNELRGQYQTLMSSDQKPTTSQLRDVFIRSVPTFSAENKTENEKLWVAKQAVAVAFHSLSGANLAVGTGFWQWIINTDSAMRPVVLLAIADHWERTVHAHAGLFSRELDGDVPIDAHMEYAPTNKKRTDRETGLLSRHFAPHVKIIEFLRSALHTSAKRPGPYLNIFLKIVRVALHGVREHGSLHALARPARLSILALAFDLLSELRSSNEHNAGILEKEILQAGLAWYRQDTPQWPFGGNLVEQRRIIRLLGVMLRHLNSLPRPSNEGRLWYQLAAQEQSRLMVWLDPLGEKKTDMKNISLTPQHVNDAWDIDPSLAVSMLSWSATKGAREVLLEFMKNEPLKVVGCASGLEYFVELYPYLKNLQYTILYWTQVSPIESINLLSPRYGGDSFLLQYALRSLESHPISKCFFYVPQIVQQLRYDKNGYIEEYILEAAKFSQKFAHQIIWNIKANSYLDDDGTVPDPMKPTLDRVLKKLQQDFTQEEREFYDTEFGFFSEVTGISGKLKPYIRKSKLEKKAKIDEEMAKISVPGGVYLPSNPDGDVVDIDRESGKPLQSHAKAPFLAKFKIRRKKEEIGDDLEKQEVSTDTWQGAIFKVGDDCRQDLLALQIISVFRSIFNYWGIDVFVFPYRVVATAPGQGVIDVLPDSISRDMLGREAVNGLHEWFVSKFGGEDSLAYQRARNNFVKSMAAYSVISWLIQFKDRHNGNIMYDDQGHVIHIDFGFCFDIVPGGVRFEAAPFKLTKEMVAVMGGSPDSQSYKWFEELTVKVFLASRVYAEDICRLVAPMLDSGLPCFKGDTLGKLRSRFALNRTEREAAQYMRKLISRSYESNFTKGYDEFQRLTNGIPY